MKEYDANQHGGEEENRESLVARDSSATGETQTATDQVAVRISLIVGSVVRPIVRRAGIEPAT